MKSLLKILAVVCIALLTAQCEVIDSDLLEDPNNPSPENVDADFLFNNIQQEARDIYQDAAETGAEMTRMRYMFGSTYGEAYTPQSTNFTDIYKNAYADMFVDVENILPIAEEQELYFHAGAAKILKAYALITLVDLYGDVPLAEALDESNFNPGLSEGRAVYDSALVLLDDGIADLQSDYVRAPDNDLYYGSEDDAEAQAELWIRTANTIKLKAYLNTDNASAIQSLINDDMLITESGHNFTFEFGTSTTNPDSRHPGFADNYQQSANDYMTVNYMNMMLEDKSDEDPRIPYYFYRQTTTDPTDINLNTCIADVQSNNIPGHFNAGDPFCLLGDGYWGRDHLIDDGIPPDNDFRTTFGIYPAGGAFDEGQGVATEPDMGLQGAGFEPILMSSFTHFMIAEYEEKTGNGDARSSLGDAIRHSFDAVRSAAQEEDQGTGFEITDGDRDDYVDNVLTNRYDGARDNLRVIAKEYYLALWPNGLEAYNLMRRTGYPNHEDDNLQPARSGSPGDWYSTFLYPANMVERNSSVDQKTSRAQTTFWDDGSYDFNF